MPEIDYSQVKDLQVLRDRIEELESLLGKPNAVVRLFNLTYREMQLCTILASRVSVSKEHIYTVMYNGLGEVELKIIDVFVCKVRRKLPSDIEILTIWGRGYSMPPASRHRWQEHFDAAS